MFLLDSRSTPRVEGRKRTGTVGSGVGLGAGPDQKVRGDSQSQGPHVGLPLGSRRLFIPRVPAQTRGGSVSPAITAGQMESRPLAVPCRAVAGQAWGRSKGRGEREEEKGST